jgi:hypothetical protein
LPGGSLFQDLAGSDSWLSVLRSPATRPTYSDFPLETDSGLADYRFDPQELGFIPPDRWKSGDVRLGDVIEKFFKARSSKVLRFEHKLWNALALTNREPRLYSLIGVKWVTPTVLKVDRNVFGRFLNVTRPAAALYNNQGSFMTHGFVEVWLRDVPDISDEDTADLDESVVRLFQHAADSFNMQSDKRQVMRCRYSRS